MRNKDKKCINYYDCDSYSTDIKNAIQEYLKSTTECNTLKIAHNLYNDTEIVYNVRTEE